MQQILKGLFCGFVFSFLSEMKSYGELLEGGHTVEDHIHWLEMLVKEKLDQVTIVTLGILR